MKSNTLVAVLLALVVCCHASKIPLATNYTVYITSYGYNDNSPPSAEIAYPKSDGYPTIHNEATEGSGTYDDPVTFATDKSELAVGSRIYVVHMRKYFIMEDDCVECDSDWGNGKRHVDMWMGPNNAAQPEPALDNCEDKVTRTGIIIANPPTNLPVDTTPMFANGKCTAVMYNN